MVSNLMSTGRAHRNRWKQVNYLGEATTFSATQVYAMYLAKLKDTASVELKAAVNDVSIAVPVWYTEAQRRAVIDAAEIAGLNPLRLINDTTATALGYGITKTDLPAVGEPSRNVVFVDVGQTTPFRSFRSTRVNSLSRVPLSTVTSEDATSITPSFNTSPRSSPRSTRSTSTRTRRLSSVSPPPSRSSRRSSPPTLSPLSPSNPS